MTHKLISIHTVAERLDVPVAEVVEYVGKGWIVPDVPGQPSYFDASKVERLKRRLPGLQRRRWRRWAVLGAFLGFAATLWLVQRPRE